MTEEAEKKEWVSPTDEEKEILQRQIYNAMLPLFKETFGFEDEHAALKKMLRAIQLGRNLEKDANKAFAKRHPNNYAHDHYAGVAEIAATCTAHALMGVKDSETCPVISAVGALITVYAGVINIFRLSCDIDMLLNGELEIFSSSIDGTMQIVESYK